MPEYTPQMAAADRKALDAALRPALAPVLAQLGLTYAEALARARAGLPLVSAGATPAPTAPLPDPPAPAPRREDRRVASAGRGS